LDKDIVAVGGFVVLFLLMVLRVPIGISMGLVGVGGFAVVVGSMGPALNVLELTPIRAITNFEFGLVPLFILMGVVATESGMSTELFGACSKWLGRQRGGMALATVAACAGFAAICGSSVATAATMSNVALPEMRRLGYPDTLSTGVVAAGGTLGILIPPSVVLAIYGIIVEQDIAALFMAGLLPGILATLMYMMTVRVIGALNPAAVPIGEPSSWQERLDSLRGIWAVVLLFLFVIGGIYDGVFTPTEAAGMGAGGAIIIAVARRRLPWPLFVKCFAQTVRTTAAVFTILIGALLFGQFLAVTQAPQHITNFLVGLPIGKYGLLFLLLLVYLGLGCVLDAMAMVLLTVPIVFPVIVKLGFDPIWFGVIIVMAVELALITPPVGMNVFVIKGVIKDTSLKTIFAGVTPFIFTDVVRLLLLVIFPGIVLFLPRLLGAG
jgi:tripartite ATP-independent transporter DctM subunit